MEVQRPAQRHLDRDQQHHQQQRDHHAKSDHAHVSGKLSEKQHPKHRRTNHEIRRQEENPPHLTNQVPGDRPPALGGQRPSQHAHPRQIVELDVQQCRRAIVIPELVWAEKVPVRSAQKRPKDDEHHPQSHESEHERGDGERALRERVVPVAAWIAVEIRDGDQPHHDEPRQHHARQPGVEVDQQLLQSEEVPRRFGGVGGDVGIGGLLQRSGQHDGPHHQQPRGDHDGDQFDVHQVGPDQHLVVRAGLDERLAALHATVVDGRLTKSEPEQKAHREQHHHDRHVVRFGDDQLEVLVHRADDEKQNRHAPQHGRHLGFGERAVTLEEHGQRQHRNDEEPVRLAQGVDHALERVKRRPGCGKHGGH